MLLPLTLLKMEDVALQDHAPHHAQHHALHLALHAAILAHHLNHAAQNHAHHAANPTHVVLMYVEEHVQ